MSRQSSQNCRQLACLAVKAVLNPSNDKPTSLDDAIERCLPKLAKPDDSSLFKLLSYNACRWHKKLTAISRLKLNKPLKTKHFDIQIAINLGIYQLLYLRVADHAAIKETVDIAYQLKKPWAAKLINAVLRGLQKETLEAIERSIVQDKATLTSHPSWLVNKISKQWPQQTDDILRSNNINAPLTLRINEQHTNRQDYLNKLQELAIEAKTTPFSPVGVSIDRQVDIQQLPGFIDGMISVQDEAAQLAARLLAPNNGEAILDACAAPGGKSTHLLELAPQASLTSLDISKKRIEKLDANFKRLNMSPSVICADLLTIKSDHFEQGFDKILLDAPCSGSGVIRRHPDIKWLRKPEDIDQLSATQLNLLHKAWDLLNNQGRLLYCTCSILHEENDHVIQRFLLERDNASLSAFTLPAGTATQFGHYLLPSEDGHDGFYYALLEKNDSI